MSRTWLAAVVFVLGCGSSSHDSFPDSSGGGSDAATDASGPAWTPLVSRTWSLTPGEQTYKCSRVLIDHDMWINAFHALSPTGTHHEVVTLEDTLPSGATVGDYDCDASSNLGDIKMLYAAGVMTDDLMFPAGVAIHVAAGQYVNVNVHLFDTTDMPENDTSGVSVQTVDQAAVQQEADMTFAGTYNIYIPAMQSATAVGGCAVPTVPGDWHVFALWPHMHQTAVHQKLTVTHNGTTTTPLDVPYSFFEQRNYPMPEMTFAQGDQVQVTCSYTNTTASPVMFGESSTDEMCFTGIYKYPAGGGELGCVH